MPQMLLPLFSEGPTDINNRVGCQKEGGMVYYFLGQYLIRVHEEDDVRSFRLATSHLVEVGLASQAEIVRAFGVTPISVKRSVKLLREHGDEGFFRKRRGRSPHVMTPKVLSDIQRLLSRGLSPAQAARKLGMKADTIRKAVVRGRLSAPKKKTDAILILQRAGASAALRTAEPRWARDAPGPGIG